VAGDRRRLRNQDLHNLYASPNVIKMIRSGKIRWMVHLACDAWDMRIGICGTGELYYRLSYRYYYRHARVCTLPSHRRWVVYLVVP